MTDAYRLRIPSRPRDEAKYHTREELCDGEMHLEFFRACGLTYSNVYSILWSANTFSFNSASRCQQFFDDCSDMQKAAPKSLHLIVNTHQSSTQGSVAPSNSLIRSLKSLMKSTGKRSLVGCSSFIRTLKSWSGHHSYRNFTAVAECGCVHGARLMGTQV